MSMFINGFILLFLAKEAAHDYNTEAVPAALIAKKKIEMNISFKVLSVPTIHKLLLVVHYGSFEAQQT